MKPFLPIRIFRLSLAISVSLWMAGAGCLLGCSNSVKAAPEDANANSKTVVAGDSCAAKHSHDCCAKRARTQNESSTEQTKLLVPKLAARQGMMEHCPLAVNASAAISKARTDGADGALARDVPFVVQEHSKRLINSRSNASLLYNRGPTYLRCCTFLI